MRKGIALVVLAILFPATAVFAQVFNQNQIILPPFGSNGFVVSTTTGNSSKLSATSTPYFANFFATVGNILRIGNLTSNGFVTTSSGNGTLGVDTTAYTPTSRTLTVAGTANQVTSSAGAQDLSANRTWTLSLPNHVIFPGNFFANNSTTTNATTTALDVTSLFTFGGVTGNSWDDFCTTITGSSALCDGNDASGSGSGNVSTSSAETAGRVPFWTSTAATPAALSGGVAGFAWDNTLSRLTATNASTTNLTIGNFLSFNGVVGTTWASFCTSITGGSGLCDGTDDTSGGGAAIVSTSTNETAGNLSYWTTTSGTPARLGQVATGTLAATSPVTVTAGRSVVGGAATVAWDFSVANTWTGLQTFGNSTTSLASFNYASSTLWFGGGLGTCNSTNNWLTWASGRYGCAALDVTGDWTGTIDGNNFTGGAVAQGDLLYGSAAGVISELTKDTNATRYLSNQGASNNPSWNQVNLTNGVTGTLPYGNGGTGSTTAPVGQLLYGGSTAYQSVATSSATCTGASGVTCTTFTIVGSGGSTIALSAIPNSSLANSTISGVSLGSNLANLTATDATLTFSGTYNGSAARTIGLNLGNANTWTALQTFGNSTTSLASFSYASSTVWRGGGLTTDCDTAATSKLLWDATTGQFSCGTDQTGAGGGSWPFTPTTNFGQNVQATTTALWMQATPFSFFASSTAVLTNASTSQLTVSNALYPATDDGAALGSTAFKWSDAFWANGSVLNWNNGDVLLTHSANTLTLSGGSLTFSGNDPDVTTGTNEHFNISPNGTGRVGISSTTPMSLLGVAGTTTTQTLNVDMPTHSGTSTMYIYSNTSAFGGEIVVEDMDGAGCTSITTLNGVLYGNVATCPTAPVAN